MSHDVAACADDKTGHDHVIYDVDILAGGGIEDDNIAGDHLEQATPAVMQSRVLDRLAEILARYKTDPKTNRGLRLDAKHVSSTMMIVDLKKNMVKILSAKNEGIDQMGFLADTDFLTAWKEYMEGVSQRDECKISEPEPSTCR